MFNKKFKQLNEVVNKNADINNENLDTLRKILKNLDNKLNVVADFLGAEFTEIDKVVHNWGENKKIVTEIKLIKKTNNKK